MKAYIDSNVFIYSANKRNKGYSVKDFAKKLR